MTFQIIYMNGATSSGKSTLAKALQEALEPPFLHVGIDKIIEMMPDKLNDWTGGSAPLGFSWKESRDEKGYLLQNLEVGPFARKVSDAYYEVVVLLAKLRHHLIIDDIAIEPGQVNRWRNLLQGFSVLYVSVKAPLDVLEQREKLRGNRIIGSSRAQYHRVHTGNHYDLELDTTLLDIRRCVQSVVARLQK